MRKTIGIAILMACMSSIAPAQTSQSPAKSVPVAGSVQLGIDVTTLDWVAVGYRASKLLKAKVYNDKDVKIGKIDDLLIKPDGTINVVIVDVGGFLGLATHRVAIPVNQFTSVEPKITLPGATKESLKALPEFKFAK